MSTRAEVSYVVQFENNGTWLRVNFDVPTIEEAREKRAEIEANATWMGALRIVKITEEVVE